MLQEQFSEFVNIKTETLDISLLKSSADSWILQASESHIDPETLPTVANWLEECANISRNDFADMSEDVQSRLVLWRLDTAENEKLNDFIHPRTILNLDLVETVLILSNLFSGRNFELPNCFTCLCRTKEHDDKVFEFCDLAANLKDDLKCPLFNIANECIPLDTKCGRGMNQENSGEKNHVNGSFTEIVSSKVSTYHKTLAECWLCNDLYFARFVRTNLIFTTCVANEDIGKPCGELNHSGERRPSPRKLNQLEQKDGEKRKQPCELAPVMVTESKPVLREKAVGKTENEGFPLKAKMNAVFCCCHSKQTLRTKRKKKERFYEKEEGAMIRKLEAVFDDFWTVAHSKLMRDLQ
ncbi:hypothetical protein ACTXT7_017558 [Hymenolepis weldensis]